MGKKGTSFAGNIMFTNLPRTSDSASALLTKLKLFHKEQHCNTRSSLRKTIVCIETLACEINLNVTGKASETWIYYEKYSI